MFENTNQLLARKVNIDKSLSNLVDFGGDEKIGLHFCRHTLDCGI